jgi:ribosomal protein S21
MSSISILGHPSYCPPPPLSHQYTQTGAKPPRPPMKRKFAEISAERTDPVEVAFSKFKKSLYYHGTSSESKKRISKYGMDVSKKISGCNEMLKSATGLDDKAASHFNYVMSIESAANYAKMHPKLPLFRF